MLGLVWSLTMAEVIKELLGRINSQEKEIKALRQVSAVFANEIEVLKHSVAKIEGSRIAPTDSAHKSTALERSRARKTPSHAPANS